MLSYLTSQNGKQAWQLFGHFCIVWPGTHMLYPGMPLVYSIALLHADGEILLSQFRVRITGDKI